MQVKCQTGFQLNIGNTSEILDSIEDEEIEMSFHNEKELQMEIGGFIIPTLPLTQEQRVPDLKHTTNFKISTTEFYKLLKRINLVSESVMFEAINEKVIASAEGETIKFRKEIGNSKGENSRAKYSVEYLQKKYFNDWRQDVSISFGKDYPMAIEDGRGNKLILASRVESE